MVYLSRIYTRSGDDGQTSLGDGARIGKDSPRVAALGSVDELNCVLGIIVAHDPSSQTAEMLRRISNDLFDVGADLCLPIGNEEAGQVLRISPEQVAYLEREIDRINEPLSALTSFILPGGTVSAAWSHFARAVCRRAEREVVAVARVERVNPNLVQYVNRLSDLLFVLARDQNNQGRDDVLWKPGQSQSRSNPDDRNSTR